FDPQNMLHVAAGDHVSRLQYFRTTGPVTAPSHIQTLARPSSVPTPNQKVTYPTFYTSADGRQFFMSYRHGNSSNGDTYTYKFDLNAKTWRNVFADNKAL